MQQYLKSSGYTLLQVLSDKAQNDAVSTTQTKKTNNALQSLLAFKDHLKEITKYKSFGTLRYTYNIILSICTIDIRHIFLSNFYFKT